MELTLSQPGSTEYLMGGRQGGVKPLQSKLHLFFNSTEAVNLPMRNQKIIVPVYTVFAGPSMNVSFPR
jgi:hypothetical protein